MISWDYITEMFVSSDVTTVTELGPRPIARSQTARSESDLSYSRDIGQGAAWRIHLGETTRICVIAPQ